jgi:hypothetical protein
MKKIWTWLTVDHRNVMYILIGAVAIAVVAIIIKACTM